MLPQLKPDVLSVPVTREQKKFRDELSAVGSPAGIPEF